MKKKANVDADYFALHLKGTRITKYSALLILHLKLGMRVYRTLSNNALGSFTNHVDKTR